MGETSSKPSWTYEAVYAGLVVLLVGLAIYLIGRPRVGVVDLRQVATSLGVSDQLAAEENRWMVESQVRSDELKENLRKQLEPLSKELEQATDNAARARIREQIGRARQQSQDAVAQLLQEYQGHRDRVRREFRKRLDPVIRKIARSRRLDLVAEWSGGNGVVYASSRADITPDVVEQARDIFKGVDWASAGSPTNRVERPKR